jgi:hypothetical protein
MNFGWAMPTFFIGMINCNPETYRSAREKMVETMFVACKGEAIVGFYAL